MTEQHIKEQLSRAFVRAISANAGFILRKYEVDYGLDGKFSDVVYEEDCTGHKRYSENGFGIDFQLKATTNIVPKDGYLIYDLEAKNYNDLVKTCVGTPRILIVYSMPKDRNQWLEISQQAIILKKCAWWCSLKGLPSTKNNIKKRIKIPDSQLLTTQELSRLINLVKGGAEL